MKFVHLQVLRAFAALLVVMHHAQHEAAALAAATGAAFVPSTLLPWPAGVDVFFVISGFIIVHASAPLYGRAGGRRRFLAHRVARLVPLYWLVSAAYLAVALRSPALLSGEAGANGLDPAYVLASFLFWPAARADGAALPLYGLGWTLNCEMFFYALFALGLGWGRRGAVAWLVLSLAMLAGVRAAVPGLPTPLAFWTNPIILEFALGALIGLARAEGARVGAGWCAALALAGLLGLATAPEPGLALRPLLYGLPAALLVAAATLGRASPAQKQPALPLRAGVLLGDASYALYLVHPFVLRAAREGLLRLGLAPLLGPWPGLILMVALAVVAALLVHRFVERPSTRRARRLLDPEAAVAQRKAFDEARLRVPREAERI